MAAAATASRVAEPSASSRRECDVRTARLGLLIGLTLTALLVGLFSVLGFHARLLDWPAAATKLETIPGCQA